MKRLFLFAVALGLWSSQGWGQIYTVGLQVWYEADNGVTCTAACADGLSLAAAGSNWNDKTTNANNLKVNPGQSAPVYHTNRSPSGLPAITFNGSNTCEAFVTALVNNQAATTIIAGYKNASTAAKGTLVDGAVNAFTYWTANGGPKQQGADKSGVVQIGTSTSAADLNNHLTTVTYDGTTLAFRTDRAADGSTTNAQTISASENFIGCSEGNNAAVFNADLYFLLIYNAVVSGTNLTNTENTLYNKWFAAGASTPVGFNKRQKLCKLDEGMC